MPESSLHATLVAAFQERWPHLTWNEQSEVAERAFAAWLADPATIERAAQALATEDARPSQFADQIWGMIDEEQRDEYRRVARAALGAMTNEGMTT